jgi:hypothetical protein
MEYVLIIVLQLLGFGLHVGQTIMKLDALKPDDTLGQVFGEFWKTDRITVLISAVILLLCLVVHYIVGEYTDLHDTVEYYELKSFGVSFVLGYAGQFLIYLALGKAVDKAKSILEDKLK